MHTDRIPAPLPEVRAAIERLLHLPGNLGVQLSPLRLPGDAEASLLLLYVDGLADRELIRLHVMQPLRRLGMRQPAAGGVTAERLAAFLPSPGARTATRLSPVIAAVLAGATALFVAGAAAALVVETAGPLPQPAGGVAGEAPYQELFANDLGRNVALLRKRLRDPALVARPRPLPRGRAARAALVYMEGRAAPDLVARVGDWLRRRGGEEALHRGLHTGVNGLLGLVPDVFGERYPDKVAALLDAGYVAVLVDRVPLALLAPVTLPAVLQGPLDTTLRRPLAGLLPLIRLIMAGLVLIASATVVALMNYHQEMMPTPILLALAAGRESAPFPVALEVLALEVMQELIREAGFHLPLRLAPGSALIAGKVLVLILVLGGLVGPLQAAVSMAVTFASLGLLNYEVIYMTRIWRLLILGGAGMLGFYGLAAVAFCLLAYLTQAESFGVPFWGPTGLRFTATGRVSSRRQGGALHAADGAVR